MQKAWIHNKRQEIGCVELQQQKQDSNNTPGNIKMLTVIITLNFFFYRDNSSGKFVFILLKWWRAASRSIFQQVESHPYALAHIKYFNASCCHECKKFPLTLLCVAYNANKKETNDDDEKEEENLRARQRKRNFFLVVVKYVSYIKVGAMFSRKPKSFRRKRSKRRGMAIN